MGKEVENVLWFDQKKGFGFVKVFSLPERTQMERVFVHFSSTSVKAVIRNYFRRKNVLDVEKNNDPDETNKEFLSSNITGLYGSPLLVDNGDYMFEGY